MSAIPIKPTDADLRSPQGARVVRCGAERLVEAATMLLAQGGTADAGHVERFLRHARDHAVALDRFWGLEGRDGRLNASVLAVPNPGRTAMVFATAPWKKAGVEEVGWLLDQAMKELAGSAVVLGQALLEPRDQVMRKTFVEGGFCMLANLAYLERHLPAARDRVEVAWPSNARVTAYAEQQRASFEEALERSYEATTDCPGLCGIRATSDILNGHQATGEFDPSLWTLLLVDDMPAGVLLLNPSPAANAVELVYLGVAKAARGAGLGRRLLQHGMNLVCGRTERAITLAVDENNTAARTLYQSMGFRTTLRRLAMIRRVACQVD